MPVHKNTTCALQTGYKPTCLCIKTQHVHFKKAINPHACAQNTHPEPSIKYQNILKPTCLCTKAGHRGETFGPKRLKTHTYSSKNISKSAREPGKNLLP